MRFPIDASVGEPQEKLCDCCFKPAAMAVYEVDEDRPDARLVAHWCEKHEYWWQRLICNFREFWRINNERSH